MQRPVLSIFKLSQVRVAPVLGLSYSSRCAPDQSLLPVAQLARDVNTQRLVAMARPATARRNARAGTAGHPQPTPADDFYSA